MRREFSATHPRGAIHGYRRDRQKDPECCSPSALHSRSPAPDEINIMSGARIPGSLVCGQLQPTDRTVTGSLAVQSP